MPAEKPWSTPADLEVQVERLWDKGQLLLARIVGEPRFPVPLRLVRPNIRALSERFDEVRRWIRALEQGSKSERGVGYEITWTEHNHRQLGRNRVPAGVVLPSEADALALIGKRRQADRFADLVETTMAALPSLRSWLLRRPLSALEHADDWQRVLAVLLWFRDHPRSGLYLRQLDIAGIDTKFIETRRGLLSELLSEMSAGAGTTPAEDLAAEAAGPRSFEQRHGLRSKPALVRFRILDERQHLHGLSDIATPAAEFARLALPARTVFITENETNGFAFPAMPDGIVIFGLGYGLDRLAEIRWLQQRPVLYWGDIDTHGFAILDRLRALLPNVRSFLMDRETLMLHRHLWVEEPERHRGALTRLNEAELALFEDLAEDRLGSRVRLEQERIPFGWLARRLEGVAG